MLYFAYGSNLDAESWELWCKAKGHDPASIEPLGPAWLPDHELVFHYQSTLRKSGALDVRPRHGTSVQGALFRAHDWESLDTKEGVAGAYYQRKAVTALTDDGHAHAAFTYRVCDARVGSFVPPSPAYRETVMRGLSRFGHGHDAFVAVASGAPAPPAPSALFAYGTLMRGERSHALLASRVRHTHPTARVTGASLVHIDWYPGLVLREGGSVHGEVHELDEPSTVLQELDEYEDFAGYHAEGSMYRRSLVRAVTDAGSLLAWTYVYLGDAEAFPAVLSGRWSGA